MRGPPDSSALSRALAYYDAHPDASRSVVARQFGVPRTTFRRHVTKVTQSTKIGRPEYLDDEQLERLRVLAREAIAEQHSQMQRIETVRVIARTLKYTECSAEEVAAMPLPAVKTGRRLLREVVRIDQ